MKKTLINLGITAGAVFVLYRLFKKDDIVPMKKPLPQDTPQPIGDDNFSNFSGFMKKAKKPKNSSGGQRAVATKCATNLDRLGMLYPNPDQYNAEIGKAYEREGANFMKWAQAEAKPCFVVGADQGGLQSGGISFDGSLQEIISEGKKRKIMGRKQKGFRTEGFNFSGSDFTFQGAGDF
ncbi:hypothetical protein EBU94_05240 [bacterium]|nr:hypothetical protein [bacterium]